MFVVIFTIIDQLLALITLLFTLQFIRHENDKSDPFDVSDPSVRILIFSPNWRLLVEKLVGFFVVFFFQSRLVDKFYVGDFKLLFLVLKFTKFYLAGSFPSGIVQTFIDLWSMPVTNWWKRIKSVNFIGHIFVYYSVSFLKYSLALWRMPNLVEGVS